MFKNSNRLAKLTLLFVASALIGPCGVVSAQGDSRKGRDVHEYSSFVFESDYLQRHLEMTREQRREMFELTMDYRDELEERKSERVKVRARLLSKDENGKSKVNASVRDELSEFDRESKELAFALEEKVREEILLPHQRREITQLNLRDSLRFNNGFFKAMPQLHKVLRLDEKEIATLNAKEKKIAEELNDVLVEFFDRAKLEMLEEFSSEDREIIDTVFEDYGHQDTDAVKALFHIEGYFWRKRKEER